MWLIHNSLVPSLDMVVIRGGQLKTIDVPLLPTLGSLQDLENQYVYLSGLILQNAPPDIYQRYNNGIPSVIVSDVIPQSVAETIAQIPPESILVEIEYNKKNYPIQTLGDLKNALQGVQQGEVLRIFFRSPLVMRTPSGMMPLPFYHHESEIGYLPVQEVFNSDEVPVRDLKTRFDWTGFEGRRGLVTAAAPSNMGCRNTFRQLAKFNG